MLKNTMELYIWQILILAIISIIAGIGIANWIKDEK